MKPNKSHRPSKAEAEAAKKSTKDGQQVTRNTTASRKEVRQQTLHKQGHPK
ncbi:MAG: hypothetical protein SGJ20_01255 [Planctomycetota bacterium]|nr:hypothetical protein [Planctomycetota bacterium]